MPQLQWLGTIPQNVEGSFAGALGEAIGAGFESYAETKERGEEREFEETELKYKIDTLEHSKKVDAARLITSVMSHVPEEKRMEMINDPEIIAVYASAGVPIPTTPPPEVSKELSVGPWNPLRATPWFAYKGDEGKRDIGITEKGDTRREELDFDSLEEAEAANLPKGTMITIGGRKARVD